MKSQANSPILNTTLGIIALVLIAFFLNWLVSLSSLGNRTLDLTEAKVHTLTDGTKAILQDLQESDAEVVINYYATRDSDYMPRELELYMKQVDDFLKRYSSIAGENLRVVNLDPKPDTDAEDSANLDGIAGRSFNEENIYLGLSVSSLDQKATIPFLSPANSTQLEYQISSAIAQVARTDRPTLGLMSALPIAGNPQQQMQMPGMPPQPGSQPFIIYQQLQQFYDLKEVGMDATFDDLKELTAVLVVHPAGITPETEYALDQYLLSGGTIVAALDAFSITAQATGGGNPMMGQQGTPTTSTFSDQLLTAWGVSFESGQVVADGKYRTRMQQGDSTAVLSLTKEAMPLEDSLITSGLNDLFFILPGGFLKDSKDGLSYQTLIRTTKNAGLVDSQAAAQLSQDLLGSMRPDENSYDLALYVNGSFKSAFPDGNPAETTEEDAGDDSTTESDDEGTEKSASLKQSQDPGNLFLIADTDFLGDQFAYVNYGAGMVAPQGDNAALLFNILDQVTGSKYLIGSRSRGDSRRPFTVIQEMESEFEQEFGEKLEKEQAELDQISTRINELIQTQQTQGAISLEGDLAKELENAREKQVEARKRLRTLEKDLRSRKDALAARYTLANLFIVPVLVIIIAIVVFLKRRAATKAR
jgi:ABC-type uncharacterized transport system involved in gliding motility auxiliary subunit